MIDRFDDLGQHTNSLLIPVLFGQQYSNEVNRFLAKHPERAFLISRTKNNHTIDLGQVIDRIMDALSNA
jgi:hypothetical protein